MRDDCPGQARGFGAYNRTMETLFFTALVKWALGGATLLTLSWLCAAGFCRHDG